MSKHPIVPNVHLTAGSRTNPGGLLPLAALLLGGLAVPASAQSQPAARVVPEKHFTIPAGVTTPMVFRTEPDAACDLHATGVNDPTYTMRLSANMEGYVRFHFTPFQSTQDAYLQIDCTTPEAVTTYPIHLAIAASPTEDMPTPLATVPIPAGSKIRPALTDEAARQLSDEDILSHGYPPRPNAAESPEAYANWLSRVSRAITILPPHSVKRFDISHLPRTVIAGTNTSTNWSGLVAQRTPGTYRMVDAQWTVPSVTGEVDVVDVGGMPTLRPGPQTYSALWIGLDGNSPPTDLVQAGTEQDARSLLLFGTATSYYAWTEIYPDPTAGLTEAFSVSPGDYMAVSVWVGDSDGNVNPSGGYAWFNITDDKLGVELPISTALGPGFGFTGNSAEWIMERLYITALNGPGDLADYNTCEMAYAGVETAAGMSSINYSSSQNQQLTLYAKTYPQPTDMLATVSAVSGQPSSVQFIWKNFH